MLACQSKLSENTDTVLCASIQVKYLDVKCVVGWELGNKKDIKSEGKM